MTGDGPIRVGFASTNHVNTYHRVRAYNAFTALERERKRAGRKSSWKGRASWSWTQRFIRLRFVGSLQLSFLAILRPFLSGGCSETGSMHVAIAPQRFTGCRSAKNKGLTRTSMNGSCIAGDMRGHRSMPANIRARGQKARLACFCPLALVFLERVRTSGGVSFLSFQEVCWVGLIAVRLRPLLLLRWGVHGWVERAAHEGASPPRGGRGGCWRHPLRRRARSWRSRRS